LYTPVHVQIEPHEHNNFINRGCSTTAATIDHVSFDLSEIILKTRMASLNFYGMVQCNTTRLPVRTKLKWNASFTLLAGLMDQVELKQRILGQQIQIKVDDIIFSIDLFILNFHRYLRFIPAIVKVIGVFCDHANFSCSS
jgi:hypothetical protein